ncbi:MAG: hypothetical protein L0Y43_01225 [Methylococcaceae bacterium]|nr:hypothetical protein [Methylococcaceae bacterium]
MDFTDAALVFLADHPGECGIFTVDVTDFSIYRLRGNKCFEVISWYLLRSGGDRRIGPPKPANPKNGEGQQRRSHSSRCRVAMMMQLFIVSAISSSGYASLQDLIIL